MIDSLLSIVQIYGLFFKSNVKNVYFFQFNKKNRETPITEITAPITPRNVIGW